LCNRPAEVRFTFTRRVNCSKCPRPSHQPRPVPPFTS
jgi:hypothetical protein